MTLGMILLFWPLVTWLMDKAAHASARQPVPAPAGAAAVRPTSGDENARNQPRGKARIKQGDVHEAA